MRIAIVHSFYTDSLPSGENAVVRMQARALADAGHEVTVVAAATDDLSQSKGYKLRTAINVMTGGGVDPLHELAAIDPEIVHVHNLFPNFSTHWLSKWAGPIVTTIHNFRPVCANGILYRSGRTCTLCPDTSQINAVIHGCYRGSRVASIPLAVRNVRGIQADPVLKNSGDVIYLSARSQSQYESFGYEAKRAHLLPNFVDVQWSDTPKEIAPAWMYVGRIAPEKGLVQLLERWPESLEIDIYGDGPDAAAVQSMTSPNIRYHGLTDRKEILERLPGAQGLVIPSTCAENFPTVYAEALASGVPVVAKSGNAVADDILRAKPGVVFEAWSEVGHALESVSSEREHYSAIARSHYTENFAEQHWLRRLIDIYEVAIQSPQIGQ